MTPKQEERIKNKISKIKAALAADRKRWGGYYNDGSILETREFAEKYFHYSFRQDHLTDFASWLSGLISSENFNLLSNRYLDLMKELAVESDVERRRLLNQQVRQLGN